MSRYIVSLVLLCGFSFLIIYADLGESSILFKSYANIFLILRSGVTFSCWRSSRGCKRVHPGSSPWAS